MPATIKQNLDAIKEAVYGEEVRTAIHDSIEQCYEDTSKGKTLAEGAADRANTAASNADTARRNAQAVVDGAVTAINDAAAQQRKSVNDLGDQLKDYLEDHYGETTDKVVAKANRSSISTVKHAIGADGQLTLTDALNEPAKKMTIHLEPKQDLHGYDHPWVGGAGKNLLPSGIGNGNYAGLTWTTNSDGSVTLNGTTTEQVWNKLYFTKDLALKSGTYRYLLGGAPVNARLTFQIANKAENDQLFGTSGSDNTFTVSADYVGNMVARFIIPSGKTFTNETFFPMIITATETDTAYTPYSNICPIEGFDAVEVISTGKNLINHSALITGKGINGSGEIVTSGGYAISPLIPANPNSQYTFSLQTTDSGSSSWERRVHAYDAQGRWLSQVGNIRNTTTVGIRYSTSFSTSADTRYLRVSYAATFGTDIDGQLELGSIATSYEPFGSTLSLNLVSSSGSTVYGGTVTVNEDGSGTLVVDTYIEDMGEIDWVYNDDGRFKGVMKNQIKGYGTADARTIDFACSCYDVLSDSSPYNGALNGVIYYAATMLWAQDNRYTDSEQYRSAMSGQTVAYPLNNPATYQLTATELKTIVGINHIWTDGTSIDLDYYSDKYGLVDRLLAAFPKDTATGNQATFADGAYDLPVEKLEIAIKLKQDLHGYDHPWPAGSEANILPSLSVTEITRDGITFKSDGNGTYSLSGTASKSISLVINLDKPITYSSGTYYMSVLNNAFGGLVGFYGVQNEGKVWDIVINANNKTQQITFATDTTITGLSVYIGNGSIVNFTFSPVLSKTGFVQTFTPYSNVCPIIGWDASKVTRCGKNLFDKSNLEMITVLQDGTTKRYGNKFDNLVPGSYTVSAVVRSMYSRHLYAKIVSSSGSFGDAILVADNSPGSATIQISSGESLLIYVDAQDITDGVGVFNLVYDVQLEFGSTATSYEPHTCQSISVSLKSVTGSTVYGGKLVVNMDGSGELTVDHYKVVLTGIENWKTNTVTSGLYYLENMPYQLIKNNGRIISDKFAATNVAGTAMSVGQMKISGTNVNFKTQYATVNDWKNALASNNVTVCYEMASPITYPLTAQQITTLLGTNHISCDAGEVTVTYHADPTLFITKKIAQALNA